MARRIGQIIKRSENRWLCRVQWEDAQGQRRGKSTTVLGTRADADRALRKLVDQVETTPGDLKLDQRKTCLGTYLADWIRHRRGVSDRTRAGYAQNLKRHVVPVLGAVKVGDLKRHHLEQLLRALAERGLAPASQTLVLRWLLPAIGEAVESGALVVDPRRGLRRPGTAPVRKQRSLSVEELRRLLTTADATCDPQTCALVYLLALSGLRPGESLALRWTDLDFSTGRTRIERALTYGPKEAPRFGPPKTRAGVRELVLPEVVLERLRHHKSRQAERYLAAGVRSELVFANTQGAPTWYRALAQGPLARLFTAAGLSDVTPYALRHSAASLLLAGGTSPAEVAQQLGHANARITLAVYSHALPGATERTAAALSRAVLGG